MMERNSKLCPKSILTFYLKLYCGRGGNSKNKMMEGIKSWLTLSKAEKQHISNKYSECQMHYRHKLAKSLKNAQPFMKKKYFKRFDADDAAKVSINDQENDSKCESRYEITDNTLEETGNDLLNDDEHGMNTVCDLEDKMQLEPAYRIGRDSFSEDQYTDQVLAEPSAPSVRTARELFEMLNTNNDQNVKWDSLSSTQKSRYRRAIMLLKNEYIVKYKAYLESLPSKKLFDHYNNFFH